jgi:hypothetical protein
VPERFVHSPLVQRVVRNSGYVLSANTASAALSFLQTLMAARLLGVAGYGLLGIITVFASNVNRLTSFRMGELVVRYVGKFSAGGETPKAMAVFKAAGLTEMLSSLVAYALVVLLSPLAARYLAKDPSTRGLFMMYGLVLLANLMAESSTALLQYFNRFRLIAAFTVAQSVLTLVLIAGAFAARGSLRSVVLAYLVGKAAWAVGITLAAAVEATRAWGGRWWSTPLGTLRGHVRELTRFAVSTNASATINLVTRDSDILWVSLLSTSEAVGYYKAARTFINIIFVPVDPLIGTTYRAPVGQCAPPAAHGQPDCLRVGGPRLPGAARPWPMVPVVVRSGVRRGLPGDGDPVGRGAGGECVLLDPYPAARNGEGQLPNPDVPSGRAAPGGGHPAAGAGAGGAGYGVDVERLLDPYLGHPHSERHA